MSTELKTVNTTRNGEVSLAQFAGGTSAGLCLQLTSKGGAAHGFSTLQLTRKDALALAAALNEWAAGERDESA